MFILDLIEIFGSENIRVLLILLLQPAIYAVYACQSFCFLLNRHFRAWLQVSLQLFIDIAYAIARPLHSLFNRFLRIALVIWNYARRAGLAAAIAFSRVVRVIWDAVYTIASQSRVACNLFGPASFRPMHDVHHALLNRLPPLPFAAGPMIRCTKEQQSARVSFAITTFLERLTKKDESAEAIAQWIRKDILVPLINPVLEPYEETCWLHLVVHVIAAEYHRTLMVYFPEQTNDLLRSIRHHLLDPLAAHIYTFPFVIFFSRNLAWARDLLRLGIRKGVNGIRGIGGRSEPEMKQVTPLVRVLDHPGRLEIEVKNGVYLGRRDQEEMHGETHESRTEEPGKEGQGKKRELGIVPGGHGAQIGEHDHDQTLDSPTNAEPTLSTSTQHYITTLLLNLFYLTLDRAAHAIRTLHKYLLQLRTYTRKGAAMLLYAARSVSSRLYSWTIAILGYIGTGLHYLLHYPMMWIEASLDVLIGCGLLYNPPGVDAAYEYAPLRQNIIEPCQKWWHILHGWRYTFIVRLVAANYLYVLSPLHNLLLCLDTPRAWEFHYALFAYVRELNLTSYLSVCWLASRNPFVRIAYLLSSISIAMRYILSRVHPDMRWIEWTPDRFRPGQDQDEVGLFIGMWVGVVLCGVYRWALYYLGWTAVAMWGMYRAVDVEVGVVQTDTAVRVVAEALARETGKRWFKALMAFRQRSADRRNRRRRQM